MSAEPPAGVRDAVILAAGNGDRFRDPNHRSKLLHPLLGKPIILRTLQSAADAGMLALHVVIGYDGDAVRRVIDEHPMPGVTVDFVHNPDWRLENGVSALKAEALCRADRFALLMGDHLFDPAVLSRLCSYPVPRGESVLAVDTRASDPVTVDEATRVRLDGDRITAIGKGLTPWHALDTGLFVFTPALFDALREAQQHGETTLSAGVQRLAFRQLMRGAAVVDASWCDIDTPGDLGTAEALFTPAGAAQA